MLPLAVLLGVIGASIAVLLYQGVALLFAAQLPRLDPAPPSPPDATSVSVVIAARDEALDLPATLDAAVGQDLPAREVLVAEGGSTDGTAAIIDGYGGRVRRVEEGPLPEGWVGKNWACWQGAWEARGEWLLFLDADVVLHPAALRTLHAWAVREGATAATLAPRVVMEGFWERTILPFYVEMVLTYFRAPHVNRDASRAALLNGQCWLVRRADYERIGGHAAVRGEVLEDIALARRFKDAGGRLRLAWAPELARTRMYRDPAELREGIFKNLHGTKFSAARQIGFLAGLVGAFWLPLAVLPVGLWAGSELLVGVGAFLAFALFGKHVAFYRAAGAPARYGLLYPVAVGYYAVGVARSLVRGLRHGSVAWKGRTYPIR